jgi:PAS domain S-box-containing protein
MFGYSRTEVIGKKVTDLGIILPEERSMMTNMLKSKGNLKNWEQKAYAKDKKQLTVMLSSVLIDHNGKKCILNLINDISERIKLETALIDNINKFQTVFDFSPTGIALMDFSNGKIMDVNQSFLEMLGLVREDIIDKTTVELGILSKEEMRTLTTELIQTGIVKNKEKDIKTKDGKVINALFSSIIIELNGRKYSLDMVIDASEMKQMKDQLVAAKELAEQASTSKELFLANMSHEIRTPMNGIIGMANLLSETRLTSEQKEYTDGIKDSSDVLLSVINDVLDIAKINAGKMSLETLPFSVNDVLKNLKLTMDAKAKEKNISFQTHLDANIPKKVMGDPFRLSQILWNLAGNAIKFTEKGDINLIAKVFSEDMESINFEFIVTDTGIGISKDKLDYIFEPFTQAQLDTTRKYGGTGLGLGIAKKLVEMQGGVIFAESKPGIGSVFTVRLGFKKSFDENEHIRVLNGEDSLNKDLRGIEVLLVEDNRVNQRVALKTLTKWGAKVEIAENGRIAISMLNAKRYDIVLMDIQMPEMDGYETTKYIRTIMSPPVAEIPIIAMTASAIRLNYEKALEKGMNEYVSKPFKPDDIYRKISKLLNRTKQHLEVA